MQLCGRITGGMKHDCMKAGEMKYNKIIFNATAYPDSAFSIQKGSILGWFLCVNLPFFLNICG